VIDFTSARPARDDLEITNSADEILYVSVEPAEILNPGGPEERRVANPNPRELGLLISPNRLVLGPGERKVVRVSLLERPEDTRGQAGSDLVEMIRFIANNGGTSDGPNIVSIDDI